MALPTSVQREQDPELLKALLDITNTKLLEAQKTITILKEQQELLEQQQKLGLVDQLAKLKNSLYQRGREKNDSVEDRDRERQEQAILLHSKALFPRPKSKEESRLDEEIIDYELSAEERKQAAIEYTGEAKLGGEEFKELAGFYEQSEEITIIEKKYLKRIHRRKKYKLKEGCLKGDDSKAVIITAPGPDKLAAGCRYSIDFAIDTVINKYLLHLPLDRQRREMLKPAGLKSISTKTLYNLCVMVGVHGEEVLKRIHQEILEGEDCVHIDESPWPLQDKNSSNGYMWVLSNRRGSYYRFEPSRSGKIAKELLRGYSGVLMSDDYGGYNRLNANPAIKRALCMAHARRKFYEIRKNYPKECQEILLLFDKLFEVETRAQNKEQLAILRREESREIVDDIYEWLTDKQQKYLPSSGLVKAIKYSLSNWRMLTKFLDDMRIPLTNNDAERTIRHAVVGRKNFYGSKTINGADTAATLYTLIETCKRHQIDPRTYLRQMIVDNNHGRSTPTPLELARQRFLNNPSL